VTEIIEPASAAEVAAALRRASDARQSIVIRGADTKSGWGRPASRVETILDMRRMNRILAHEHGDMTATVEAGASLREVNNALALHGQTLPLDPPFADRATIGGLLATNDSGPLRHRHGTPRDLVIGIQLATTDGVLSKAGGQVVKNVAGYDLSKLVTGSFGSLAAIVSATFKLAPLPAASKTLRIGARDAAAVAEIVRTVMASQLEPVAFEVVVGHRSLVVGHRSLVVGRSSGGGDPGPTTNDPGPTTNDPGPTTNDPGPTTNDPAPTTNDQRPTTILIRFASLPAVVDAQIAQATDTLRRHATDIEVVGGDAERTLWQGHATEIWDQPGAIVRASWLPANIVDGLRELDRIKGACTTSLQGRAAIGAGLIRIDGAAPAQAAVIEQLRASPLFGNVVIVRGSDALKSLADVWGTHGTRQPLFDSLKRAFDPHGVLNAGRGPL
jgi:glycolate oxidase FAD binding subunit